MTVRSAVRSALRLLSPRDRRLLGLSMVIQMGTALLDLLGVVLIGLVGALAVTAVQSQPPPEVVAEVVGMAGLGDLSDQELVAVLAGAAAAVLLLKSVVSSYLTRRVFIFLANRQALVSARLTKELLSKPLPFVQKRSSQQTAYALINGAAAATMLVLGQLVIFSTEAALLVVLAAALLVFNPWVALGAIAFFALVALALQRTMGSWASRVGAVQAEADIASLNAIQEALGAYREISVSDRRNLYVERIQRLRWRAAHVAADSQFIGMLPKYMFEAALVVGGFALAVLLFATQNSVSAVGTLALFLAAGSRVMPSILRLQGAALGLRSASGAAGPTFELATDLGNPTDDGAPSRHDQESRHCLIVRDDRGFAPSVLVEGVTVTYPGTSTPALKSVDLSVEPGRSVALVGRSGAGKSTLADVVLGVVAPDSGEVEISGVSPVECVKTWPGSIAYVPQSVTIANGSIRENVALGVPTGDIDDQLVKDALRRAHLSEYVRTTEAGLDTQVGEQGVRLSGGQRQRLGIARALYTNPRLLVLDEATSALDAETEHAIAGTLNELEGQVTTILIAHRLSTVRHADQIVYLDQGQVVASGTFEEVARDVPAFANQSSLMGLESQLGH